MKTSLKVIQLMIDIETIQKAFKTLEIDYQIVATSLKKGFLKDQKYEFRGNVKLGIYAVPRMFSKNEDFYIKQFYLEGPPLETYKVHWMVINAAEGRCAEFPTK